VDGTPVSAGARSCLLAIISINSGLFRIFQLNMKPLPAAAYASSMTIAPSRDLKPRVSADPRSLVVDPALVPIACKLSTGERLSLADGETLFSTFDLHGVLALADFVRRRLHGSAAYYNINRHLNYSNVCALSCKFCDFFAKKDDSKAYTRDMGYVREQVRLAVDSGATEMHSVGGLHPYLAFSYYTDLVSTIRDEARTLGSELHVKAFTAVEIVHLAKIAKVYRGANLPGEEGRAARREGIRFVLRDLKNAGLGSLPGGGAEVFDDRVHDEAYKGKIRSDVWLDVHREAHDMGLNTNATILYGHIESRRDRLVHMEMLRREQDRALAKMGYAESHKVTESHSHEAERTRNMGDPLGTPDLSASACEGPGSGDDALTRSEGGHLGYRADDSDAPVITLTRPGTPLPEHVAFSSSSPRAQCPVPSASSSSSPSAKCQVPSAFSSGYYQTIIPLPFFPDGCEIEHLPGPSGLENIRTLAVARLMLDNFPHVKAFWIMQTLPMAQLMLQSGADDIDGTVVWYDITKVHHGGVNHGDAAAATHQEVTPWTLQKAIREAGFEPVERDTLYRRVKRDGKKWWVE
jgi:2-iminoacetate synthase ThiH